MPRIPVNQNNLSKTYEVERSSMAEELGKIEKPLVEDFRGGRKLYFVPLIFSNSDLPQEFGEKYNRYWDQVESQITGLELKLGSVNRIYHELIPQSGDEAVNSLKQLKVSSLSLIQSRMSRGAMFESAEDQTILEELMDWSRCLSLGLQSQKVFSTVYGFYTEANKTRSEIIAKKINESLKENESGILIMGEGHHVQFPSDIRIFYISPPSLDELKRWMRDFEDQSKKPPQTEAEAHSEDNPQ